MPLTRAGKWAVLYGIVAVEVIALTGSYLQWNRLNMSQGEGSTRCPPHATLTCLLHVDYRKWMRDHHPKVLDGKLT